MKLSLKQALSDIRILANKISISEENLIVEGTCRYFLREFFFFNPVERDTWSTGCHLHRKVPTLKRLKMLCKCPPNQDFYQKKIVGTDNNNKGHTEWDMASWVACKYLQCFIIWFPCCAFALFGKVFKNGKGKILPEGEEVGKKKQLSFWSLNLIMSIYTSFIQILDLLHQLRVLPHCPNWNTSWGESKGFWIVIRVLPA